MVIDLTINFNQFVNLVNFRSKLGYYSGPTLRLDRKVCSEFFFPGLGTGFYFGIRREKVIFYKLRRSTTILPPALPVSIGIENCYSRYQGAGRFSAITNSIPRHLSTICNRILFAFA